MDNIRAKIQSIGAGLGAGGYIRPSEEKNSKFIENLKTSDKALDYLKIQRGLSDDTIEHFKLGYDIDKDAISIPEYKRGELVNIKYRHISEESKQRYSQEKGCEVWIFNEDGIDIGKEKGGILIVEGQFDAMSAWQAGFKNVISPSSGKDSYGVWLEMLDSIPKVYIAYDNDKPGKTTSMQMADRIGTEKSFEVVYPEGIKDANDYFKQNDAESFKKLIRSANAFYKYKFQGVKDVIDSLRTIKNNVFKIDCVPFVEFEEDWLAILSGTSNIGKTTHAMNIANEFIEKGVPTLVMPFERGIRTVGKRFLQVRYNKNQAELDAYDDSDWEKIIPDVLELPLYFSVPSRDEIKEIVSKAKRIFNVKVIIVDHLDYLVRKSSDNHNIETSNTLQEFKSLAQEFGILFIIVHHIKKQEGIGTAPKKPKMEDLKGSSSIYQDPEVVIMLSSPEKGQLEVDIVKNKGTMGSKVYEFNLGTGRVGAEVMTMIPSIGIDELLKDQPLKNAKDF